MLDGRAIGRQLSDTTPSRRLPDKTLFLTYEPISSNYIDKKFD
jgi:hypothetical protein